MEDYELNDQALFFTLYGSNTVHLRQENYGQYDTITVEQLYKVFAQRLACEETDRLLKLLKECP